MLAEQMCDNRNRGNILLVLASSRPDLIEVDLKRPGRVDVKIPLFPTSTPEESFGLIKALCKKRGVTFEDASTFEQVKATVPLLLTPGAAETLSVKIYRLVKAEGKTPLEALKDVLSDYQSPVPLDVMEFQISLAVREASDLDFVPAAFRAKK
jgi:hypothetical protein